MARKYLVWCSAKHGKATPELFGDLRHFDVALHDYGPWASHLSNLKAEYTIPSEGTEKLETAAANINALPPYEYYAFLDDDLEVSTEKLNLLFALGEACGLDLFQPALTHDSACSWPHLKCAGEQSTYREVSMVEVMCPFFSRAALNRCLWSFGLNQSGWGLDCCIWPKLATPYVVDAVTIRHPGPFRDFKLRMMRNGLSAFQELDIIRKINYDGPSPW